MGSFTTETEIANLALSHYGLAPIDDIDADADATDSILTALQQWYDPAVSIVCRDINLEVETVFAELIELTSSFSDEWAYAYYLPPACQKFRRILSGSYPDSKETQIPRRKVTEPAASAITITGASKATECVITGSGAVDGQVVAVAAVAGMTQLNGNSYIVSDATDTTFKIKSLTTGEYIDSSAYSTYTSGGTATPQAHKRILANVSPALVEYGVVPAVSLWEDDFAVAVSRQLAFLAGPGTVGKDHGDLIKEQEIEYFKALRKASANEGAEVFKGPRPKSKFTRARE